MNSIEYFDDFEGPNKYRFLSNFYMVNVRYEGQVYRSNEHAFQAAKTLDPGERKLVQRANTPGQAKRLGQKVTIDPLWETRKIIVMHTLLKRKFAYARGGMAGMLMDTEDAILIEGNTWHDQFWGDCRCDKHQGTAGENWLGRLLMLVRRDLQLKHMES